MLSRQFFILPIALFVAPAPAQEPQWLIDARAREGTPAESMAFGSEDGFIRGAVPARLMGEIVHDEESYQIRLDIGSESPVNCEVIREGFDPATLLRATAELTFPEIEAEQGKVEQRAVERIDAGAFGGHAYVAVDWLYRVNDGEAARLGAIKQIAAQKDGHGVYCAHIDIGYSKTFLDVVGTLVESLQFSETEDAPYFAEIHTTSLQGRPMGFATVTMTRDEEGDTKVVTQLSMVVPVTPDTLNTMDTYGIEWSRPDGSMINASYISSENGEIGTNLNLSETEDETWLVEGVFQGKEFREVIDSDAPPVTELGYSMAKRQLLATEDPVGATLTSLRWITEDPTRFHEMSMSVIAAVDDGHFSTRESVAGITAEAVFDKSTGTAISAKAPIGPMTMYLERVHVQGSF